MGYLLTQTSTHFKMHESPPSVSHERHWMPPVPCSLAPSDCRRTERSRSPTGEGTVQAEVSAQRKLHSLKPFLEKTGCNRASQGPGRPGRACSQAQLLPQGIRGPARGRSKQACTAGLTGSEEGPGFGLNEAPRGQHDSVRVSRRHVKDRRCAAKPSVL